MPPDEPNPESYSVEEMLERLREGERDKEEKASGELVVRADGTQAVRVRKRKRRTQQPAKNETPEKKRGRPVAILLGVLLVVVLALGVTVVVMTGRYNSAGFRLNLEEEITARTGGDVALEGLVVTPAAARLRSAVVSWDERRSLQALALSNLQADLSVGSFLSGNWEDETVVIESGQLALSGASGPPGPATGGAMPLPFAELRCDFMNINLGPEEAGSRFRNVELTLRKGPEGESQILWSGGDAFWSGWAPLKVDRGMAEVQEGGLKLVSLRMEPKNGTGEVTFSGRALLREGEDVELAVRMEKFSLQTVLGQSLGSFLEATISAEDGSLVLDGKSLGESELRLEFTGSAASLQDLPFLHILHTRLGDTEFVRPQFREIRGVFFRNREGIRLQNLELSAPYQMMVRGHLEVNADGALAGRLEVGVAEGKIITSTGRKRSTVFSDPQEGFCWVIINLSGTVEQPIDDLQGLLQAAAREAAARDKELPGGGSPGVGE